MLLPPSVDQSHVFLGEGADPFVTMWNGMYYLIQSLSCISITIKRSPDIRTLLDAEPEVVWEESLSDIRHKKQLWAPELHYVNGKWTIVVAASRGRNPSHRNLILHSQTDSPMGPYTPAGTASPKDDCWAIDMTYLEHDGHLYGIWSGWEHSRSKHRQNLYIARMDTPATMSSDRVCISTPTYEWETSVCAINEGPQILRRENFLVGIIYSANASWSNEYTQGILKYNGGDILDPSSWEKMSEPASDRNIGHLSFFKHHETGEDWVAYHEKTSLTYGWKDRICKACPITWNDSLLPNLRFSPAV